MDEVRGEADGEEADRDQDDPEQREHGGHPRPRDTGRDGLPQHEVGRVEEKDDEEEHELVLAPRPPDSPRDARPDRAGEQRERAEDRPDVDGDGALDVVALDAGGEQSQGLPPCDCEAPVRRERDRHVQVEDPLAEALIGVVRHPLQRQPEGEREEQERGRRPPGSPGRGHGATTSIRAVAVAPRRPMVSTRTRNFRPGTSWFRASRNRRVTFPARGKRALSVYASRRDTILPRLLPESSISCRRPLLSSARARRRPACLRRSTVVTVATSRVLVTFVTAGTTCWAAGAVTATGAGASAGGAGAAPGSSAAAGAAGGTAPVTGTNDPAGSCCRKPGRNGLFGKAWISVAPPAPTAGSSRYSSAATPGALVATEVVSPAAPCGISSSGWSNGACWSMTRGSVSAPRKATRSSFSVSFRLSGLIWFALFGAPTLPPRL